MALTVTSRGTGTHNTGATTLVPGGRSATLAVGSLGVLCMALDNAGSAGAVTCAPSSWTDAKGNVWTRRQSFLYDNGAASAGIEGAIYTAPIVVALLTTDAGTMTFDGGVSPVAKAWTWYEVIPPAGSIVTYLTGGGIAGATAANAQVTTASIAVGDAVIAGYFSENVAAVTGDSDTTNGTWTAQQTATVGTTTSGVRIATQQKVQTTTASTQSYDATVASQDRIAGYIALHELPSRSFSVVATGGGVLTSSGRKGAVLPAVGTGGGVTVLAPKGAHAPAIVSTGGGVTVVNARTQRSRAVTGTASGVAAVAQLTKRSASPAIVGGGVATITRVAARKASPAATGGGVATLSVRSSRILAAQLSGGGVLTYAETTARRSSIAATGGGAAVVTGAKSIATVNRDASIAATASGRLTLTSSTRRAVAATPTGSGVVTLSILAARKLAAAMTGGGAAALDAISARAALLEATGAGTAVVDGHAGAAAPTIGLAALMRLTEVGGTPAIAAPSGISVVSVSDAPVITSARFIR